MKVEIQSYHAENNDGKSVFKIEMVNIDCASWLKFNCVIEIEYDKHPAMKKSIAELSLPETTPETEMNIIQDILSQVTTIEGIKKCKMEENPKEVQLHNEDRLNGFLTYFAQQESIEQLAPFSGLKNQFHFRKFVHKITPYFMNWVEIDKNIFEGLIAGLPEIEEQYVHFYSTGASFYLISASNEHVNYQFYMMYTGIIALFFLVETSI